MEFAKQHRDHQQLDHLTLARALDEELAQPRPGRKFGPVAKGQKSTVAQDISELRELSRKRSKLERRIATANARDVDVAIERGRSPAIKLGPPAHHQRQAGHNRRVPPERADRTLVPKSNRPALSYAGKKSERPKRIVADVPRPKLPPQRDHGNDHAKRSPQHRMPSASVPSRPWSAARPQAQAKTRQRSARMNVPRKVRRPPGNVKLRTGPTTRAVRPASPARPRQPGRKLSTSPKPPRGGAGRQARPPSKSGGRGKGKGKK
jgi:hypothetical protein